jgi:HEAT repeat protein
MDQQKNIDAYVKALYDGREGIRLFAIRALVRVGADAVPTLIDLLKVDQGFVQDCASIALSMIGKPAIPALVQALDHPTRAIRWSAASVLSTMGEEAKQAVEAHQAAKKQRQSSVAMAS